MNDRRGFFAPRIEREHYHGPLLAGWRLVAWLDLNDEADHETGVVRLTEREMAVKWDTSKGSVGRWLAEMAAAGYVRLDRAGDVTRAGRIVVILDIEKRNTSRGNRRGKAGAENGAINPSSGADNRSAHGAMDGAKLGQSVGHVEEKENKQEIPLVPTEPDSASEGARRIVEAFDAELKRIGRAGVPSADWAAQRTIARNALKKGDMPELEAIEAIRWAFTLEWNRQRLRTYGMKVLRETWTAWTERGSRAPPSRQGRNTYSDPAGHQMQFKSDSPWAQSEPAA